MPSDHRGNSGGGNSKARTYADIFEDTRSDEEKRGILSKETMRPKWYPEEVNNHGPNPPRWRNKKEEE